MKKNITLIIMLIMVIILVALSLILGFKYVNNKKNLEKTNEEVATLTKQTEDLKSELEKVNQELTEANEKLKESDETKNTETSSIKTMNYVSADNNLRISLIEYGKNASSCVVTLKDGLSISYCGGYWYVSEGKLYLVFNSNYNGFLSLVGLQAEKNSNGGYTLKMDYSEEADEISIGNVKVYKK